MRCELHSNVILRLIGLAAACAALALSPDAAADASHIVGPGHTLAKIAKRYHVTVDALRAANGLVPGQKLRPGQRIVIPAPGAAPASAARSPARASDAQDEEYDSGRDERTKRGRDAYGRRPRQPGLVTLRRGSQLWSGRPLLRGGKLAPTAMDAFKRMLRDSSGSTHAIDPRLIQLVTQLSDHFGGKPIEIVSGYRVHSEAQYTAHSNHNLGKAIDFIVRGVPNEAVRDYCHTLADTGVGYYPNSSFVHLDVRSTSARWVDESRPGDPPRYSSVTGATETTGDRGRSGRSTSVQAKGGAEPTQEAAQ